MGSAYFRAAHLRDDPPPWILEDVLAEKLLSEDMVAELETSMAEWAPEVVAGFRASHAVRARVAEDVAIDGLAAGRHDYVILGAGADTFAWRHPCASQFVVWEVDTAETQAWKRAALAKAGLDEPPNVRFVAVDLATTALSDVELPGRATWNWLGVTMYLAPTVTQTTLHAIAATGAATVVVDFLLAPEDCDDLGRAARVNATQAVAAVGEPVRATYHPSEIDALLRSSGFDDVELLTTTALATRYLDGRARLRLPGSTTIAVATV
jgi:methyltransferase (TIGR00027 family)